MPNHPFSSENLAILIIISVIITIWIVVIYSNRKSVKKRKERETIEKYDYDHDEILQQWLRVFITRCEDKNSELYYDYLKQKLNVHFNQETWYRITVLLETWELTVTEWRPAPGIQETICKYNLMEDDLICLQTSFMYMWKNKMLALTSKLIVEEQKEEITHWPKFAENTIL